MCLYFTWVSLKLQDYFDVDLAVDTDREKSKTYFIYTLGRIVVSWSSNLQKIVLLSTMEVEYGFCIGSSKGDDLVIEFLEDLKKKNVNDMLYNDNQTIIFLVKNSVYHSRTKPYLNHLSFYLMSSW